MRAHTETRRRAPTEEVDALNFLKLEAVRQPFYVEQQHIIATQQLTHAVQQHQQTIRQLYLAIQQH